MSKDLVKQILGLDDNNWKGISACARDQVRAFQLDAKDAKNKTIPWPDKLATNKKGAMDTLETAYPILNAQWIGGRPSTFSPLGPTTERTIVKKRSGNKDVSK